MTRKQRDVFLEAEGNAWFARNARALESRQLPEADPVLMELLAFQPPLPTGTRVLEVGCGDGSRLAWLAAERGWITAGTDPSADAVEQARRHGVDARQGTADRLPFDDGAFDVVIFGFCLYLCDRDDLFRIAAEADRVLRSPGWLVILDFYSPVPVRRDYHHRPGLSSYKMDYRTLFTWHPQYTCITQRVRHHADDSITDDPAQWVATSVLRKNLTGYA
jgi:ubiquinone/menaquinone biosynthesis C-methylase UbiE